MARGDGNLDALRATANESIKTRGGGVDQAALRRRRAREDYAEENVEAFGASVSLRQSNGRPFVTDEGHHILDCGSGQIPDPPSLARKLSEMPGIGKHGLFLGMASVVLIARGDDVDGLHRDNKLGRLS